MPPSVSVRFAGYEFGSNVSSWSVRHNPVVDGASIPLRDGTVIRGSKHGPIEIELRGSLVATTPENMRTQRDAMLIAIMNRKGDLSLFDDRVIEAQVNQYQDEYVEGSGLLALNFSIVFVSTLPYQRSSTLQSSSVITTTSGSASLVATNAGNHPAYCRITVEAPAGGVNNNLVITNTTRNESLQYFGNIVPTGRLIVDSITDPTPTVENDGVSDIANFTGFFIKLDPGTNNFTVITEIGATVTIEWYDTWI